MDNELNTGLILRATAYGFAAMMIITAFIVC
jgi:hypothetical protein